MKQNKVSFVVLGVLLLSSSIKEVKPKIIKVWTKIQLSEFGKDFSIRKEHEFNKNLPMDKWRRLNHSIVLYELDCVNNTTKFLRLVDYDSKENIISDVETSSPTITSVIPESMNEVLMRRVCQK